MKGIDLIKRMPLELQKEFAREFVRQKSEKKLVLYLNNFFDDDYWCFFFFINHGLIWEYTGNGFLYWSNIANNKKFNALPPKAKSTKTK